MSLRNILFYLSSEIKRKITPTFEEKSVDDEDYEHLLDKRTGYYAVMGEYPRSDYDYNGNKFYYSPHHVICSIHWDLYKAQREEKRLQKEYAYDPEMDYDSDKPSFYIAELTEKMLYEYASEDNFNILLNSIKYYKELKSMEKHITYPPTLEIIREYESLLIKGNLHITKEIEEEIIRFSTMMLDENNDFFSEDVTKDYAKYVGYIKHKINNPIVDTLCYKYNK